MTPHCPSSNRKGSGFIFLRPLLATALLGIMVYLFFHSTLPAAPAPVNPHKHAPSPLQADPEQAPPSLTPLDQSAMGQIHSALHALRAILTAINPLGDPLHGDASIPADPSEPNRTRPHP